MKHIYSCCKPALLFVIVLFSLCQYSQNIYGQCSTCSDGPPEGKPLVSDNFECHNSDNLPLTGSSNWRAWGSAQNAPKLVSFNGSKVIDMTRQANGRNPDVLYLLGNKNSNRYRLSWNMYVKKDKKAYFALLHNNTTPIGSKTNENIAYEVYMDASGSAYIRIGDRSETLRDIVFNYKKESWNQFMQIIDITQNRIEFWVNGNFIYSWDFDRGEFKSKNLGFLSFWNQDSLDYSYYVDNICYWEKNICNTGITFDPVCIQTGANYPTSRGAGCDLYTSKEFTKGNCETVCNYGGNFIEIEGPPAQGRLESGLLPNSLVNQACVQAVFGKKLPGELYGEIFVFQYDLSIHFSSIGIYWYTEKGKSRPFVFKCNCDDPISNLCYQDCISAAEYYPGVPTFKESLIQGIPLDVTKKNLYYVVLLSDTPTDFTLRINTCIAIPGFQEPSPKSKLEDEGACGPCLTNNPVILDCTKPVVNGNLAGKGSEFSTDESIVYGNCARSNRKYLGEDLVHKFTLNVPSRITLTLNGFSTPMGMFLYNQHCGQNCLASAENSSSGGTASIGPVDLDAGDYYVIVDKNLPLDVGNTSYTLDLKCDEDQSPDFQYDETACPTVTINPHTVRIRAISGLLMDNLSLTLRDKINFVYDKGQGNYVLENGRYWNGQELVFQFFADQTSDGIKCGYAPNDSFNIRIIKDERNFKVKPVFNSNTAEKFNPGAQSTINRFQIIGTPSNLRVSPAFKELDANATTFPITFKALVQSDIKWEMSGLGSWVQAIRGTGNKDDELTINVLNPNPNASPRLDTLVLLGQNKELRRIVIRQKACTAASVNLGENLNVCQGERIILTPQGTGNYTWGDGSFGSTFTFTANVVGPTTYQVKSTVSGCTATSRVTVNVRPKPSVELGDNRSVCVGTPLVISPQVTGGMSPYIYKWSTGEVTNAITANAGGKYILEVTDGNGCTGSDEVAVNFKSLPVANAGLDQSICAGQSATLRASGGTSYRWSNNATSAEITVNLATSTNFTVTVTQDGCEASAQVGIKVNPNPIVIKESINPVEGERGNIQVKVSGGTPAYQFQWFRNDTLISTQEDLTGLRTAIFKLIVTDANGCKATYGPELISKTLNLEIAESIRVFPNPNDGEFSIQFHLEQNTLIEINILDALGRKILWSQACRGFKQETLPVDLSRYTPGVYLIQFKTGQLTFYKKIIRQ